MKNVTYTLMLMLSCALLSAALLRGGVAMNEPLLAAEQERAAESAEAAARAAKEASEERVPRENTAAATQPAAPSLASSQLEDLVALPRVEGAQISHLQELPKAYLDEHPGLLSEDDPISEISKGATAPLRTRDEVLAYLECAAVDE